MKAFFTTIFFLFFCSQGYTQSTLEYATLLTAAAGASKKKGNDVAASAVNGVYSDSAAAISRSSSLLQQAGGGRSVADTVAAQGGQAASDGPKPAASAAENASGLVKVYLNSGQVIEGKLIERGEDHVKVETNGIVVTFFNEEIDKIV